MINQKPSTKSAGSLMSQIKKKIGTSVNTLARGKSNRYPPRTPAIAPLAPITGTREFGNTYTWDKLATRPHNR